MSDDFDDLINSKTTKPTKPSTPKNKANMEPTKCTMPNMEPNMEQVGQGNDSNGPINTSSRPISAPLKNVKHEKFARAVIEHNGNPRLCLEAAGYKYSASYFSQLKARDDIANRISSLIAESNEGTICLLTERLELLSAIVRDKTESKSIRIKALHELHRQSGDDVTQLDVNNTSSIKYVEIELPKQQTDIVVDDVVTGNELEGFSKFIDALDNNS